MRECVCAYVPALLTKHTDALLGISVPTQPSLLSTLSRLVSAFYFCPAGPEPQSRPAKVRRWYHNNHGRNMITPVLCGAHVFL